MNFDVVVIGGGPAGLAAAVRASQKASVLVIEREQKLGGILKQCIHDGFGVVRFKEKLSGPEYAQRFVEMLKQTSVQCATFSFVTQVQKTPQGFEIEYSCAEGIKKVGCKAIVLATGCRERTRNAIAIHGDRCSGVYTAGTAQNLVNMMGVLPGKRIVILGSGDIGLIMARRLTLEGAKVLGVYEAKSSPSGLTRNIHQCLNDFDIPLHLSSTVTAAFGKQRLEYVEIAKVDENMRPVDDRRQRVFCDTLILAVGLIPENEIARKLGVQLDNRTKGPLVDQHCHTTTEGVFCCGNALHVNDLVDYVSESAEIAAEGAVDFGGKRTLVTVQTQGDILYVVPQLVDVQKLGKVTMFFRASKPLQNALVKVTVGEQVLFKKRYLRLLPPEMERIEVDFSQVEQCQQIVLSVEV